MNCFNGAVLAHICSCCNVRVLCAYIILHYQFCVYIYVYVYEYEYVYEERDRDRPDLITLNGGMDRWIHMCMQTIRLN